MKMKIHTSRLWMLLCNVALIAAASSDATLSKSHIDLLQLTDNDEFQWGLRENLQYENLQQNTENNDSALWHHLIKRQASSNPFLENKNYGSCNLPNGEQGQCRQLIYCRMPELKNDAWRLVSHLCVIEKSSVGICCPNNFSPRSGPQIITNVNDNSLDEERIVNRPEQRGCGITTKQFPRITGGRPAEPDEWPWMVAILRNRIQFVWCGGVLVTDRHVLTAAHCVHNFDIGEMFVRLGEYNTHVFNETRARDFRIAKMVTHIDYNPHTYENDIAMLRVDRATLFNTYIWPVCMPPLNENWEGQMAVVTGWGTKSFAGPHSDILMEVTIPVWKIEDCRRAMVERIPDTMICAGAPEGGQDSCQGDSGGPLLVQLANRRWVVIGLVSWGVHCGEANRPGMYTRVDKYLHWVIENSDI